MQYCYQNDKHNHVFHLDYTNLQLALCFWLHLNERQN